MADWSEPHGEENDDVSGWEENADGKRLFPALMVLGRERASFLPRREGQNEPAK